jgi:hypothetical protein
VIDVPADTAVGPVIVTVISATVLTELVTLAELLGELRAETVAVAERGVPLDPVAGRLLAGVATIAKVSALPAATLGAVKEMVLPLLTSVKVSGPLDCISETRVRPAGSVSLSVTRLALEGPAFVTVRVYVTGAPAVTGTVFAWLTCRLAVLAPAVMVTLAELLLGLGSFVAAVATTRFVRDVPLARLLASLAVTVKVSAVPVTGIVAAEKVMVLPVIKLVKVSGPPVCVATTGVRPAGRASLSKTDCAVFGPALVRVMLKVA